MARQWMDPREVLGARRLAIACSLRPGWVAIGMYGGDFGVIQLVELTVAPGTIPAAFQPDPERRPTFDEHFVHRWFVDRPWLDVDAQRHALPSTPEPHAIQDRLLRDIPLAEMHRRVTEAAPSLVDFARTMQAAGAQPRHWDNLTALEPALDNLSPARLDYLRAAVVYSALPPTLLRPAAVAAAELGVGERQARDRLRHARDLNYLSSPGQGRRGGQLTELGEALAARHLSNPRKEQDNG